MVLCWSVIICIVICMHRIPLVIFMNICHYSIIHTISYQLPPAALQCYCKWCPCNCKCLLISCSHYIIYICMWKYCILHIYTLHVHEYKPVVITYTEIFTAMCKYRSINTTYTDTLSKYMGHSPKLCTTRMACCMCN